MAIAARATYKPRRSAETSLFRLVCDHLDAFEGTYQERFAQRFGSLRPNVVDTFRRYLDCGVLAHGFLRVRCDECGHEVKVPWSCKRAGVCPCCAQRRALEFGEFVQHEILEDVPYVHVCWTVPRVLRGVLLRERALLGELARCAWETLRDALRAALGDETAVPAAITASETAGSFANPHPHIHSLFSWGAWSGTDPDARFLPWPSELDSEGLTELFRRKVLKMLLRRQRITKSTAEKLLSWRHSGFSAWVGEPVLPWEVSSRMRLARYLVKGPVSLQRLSYDPSTCEVVYRSGKGGPARVVAALDFLAELSVHVPDRGAHVVRYWGRCSNRARGERRKRLAQCAVDERAGAEEVGACRPPDSEPAAEPSLAHKRKAFRLAWAALLKRVWDVDALRCPSCRSKMRIVAAITAPATVERILRNANQWEGLPRGPDRHACDGSWLELWAMCDEQPPVSDAELPDPPFGDDPVDPPFTED